MAELLEIYRNGTLAHEFDKRAALERMQFAYVQRMDADMDRGIRVNGERILSPSQTQRNQFVIGQLWRCWALTIAAASSCYAVILRSMYWISTSFASKRMATNTMSIWSTREDTKVGRR